MNFHYPYSFWALFLFAFLILLYAWSGWKRKKDLKALGEWPIVRRLIPIEALHTRKKKDLLALLAFFLLLISATGPQFGARLKEVKQTGVEVFIAMDTSRSMLAEDVPPSRLERAKRSLSLLINKLEGNRVGIIAFAGYAVVQCPLTVDTDAAKMFLDVLDENAVPTQGTALGDAVRLAVESFPKNGKTGRAIVLLTDGEDHRSDPEGAAALAKENGISIFTIGIGTPQGEVIKKRDENGKVIEFLKHNGEMVLSRLDEGLLTKMATLTGGHYYRASSTDQEIDEIADILNGFDKKEFATKRFERYEERYQILLLLALLLFLLEFFIAERPGQWQRLKTKKLGTLFTMFFLLSPSIWADVKSQIIEGNKLFKNGDLKAARGAFESAQIDAPDAEYVPYNIATTYYLEGNFEEAKRYYELAKTMSRNPVFKSMAAYNLGHLFFNMNKREEAIEQFKEALKLNPKDVDAKYNIEYIRAGKQPQSPPPQQNQQDNKDQKDQKEKENTQKNEQAKENAERILQMIQDDEEEKKKNAKPLNMGSTKKDKKENKNAEDW